MILTGNGEDSIPLFKLNHYFILGYDTIYIIQFCNFISAISDNSVIIPIIPETYKEVLLKQLIKYGFLTSLVI